MTYSFQSSLFYYPWFNRRINLLRGLGQFNYCGLTLISFWTTGACCSLALLLTDTNPNLVLRFFLLPTSLALKETRRKELAWICVLFRTMLWPPHFAGRNKSHRESCGPYMYVTVANSVDLGFVLKDTIYHVVRLVWCKWVMHEFAFVCFFSGRTQRTLVEYL